MTKRGASDGNSSRTHLLERSSSLGLKRTSVYIVFVCAVALFAAVIGDAVVEGVSNTGALWRGNYTDRSSLDLFPVFLLAVTAFIMTKGLSLLEHARATGLSTRAIVLSTSRAVVAAEIVRLLPIIFMLQLAILYSMETTEQIFVYGHAFGGTLWLGGPVAASLVIHALCAVATAFVLSSALSALGRALTRIVRCMFARFVVRARRTIVLGPRRVFCALALIVTAAFVERGPPAIIAL
jgi:hypothetical protein